MADPKLRSSLKRPDEFVHVIGGAFQWAVTRRKVILGLLIAAGVFSLGFVGWKIYQNHLSGEAADQFYPIEKQITSPEENQDWAKIRTDLDSFLARYGSSSLAPTAHLYKGRVSLHLGEFDKAYDSYKTAEKKLPRAFKFLALEGEAYAKTELKQFAEAETIWKGLSDKKDNPLRASHLWNLGLAQEAQGQADRALATFAQFEKDFPSSPLLENVQGRIALLKKK